MKRTIILDSGPLGLLCAPSGKKGLADACKHWLVELLQQDVFVVVPEIADYEVRRDLVRAGLSASIARLDSLAVALQYLPLTTPAMKKAADLWARVSVTKVGGKFVPYRPPSGFSVRRTGRIQPRASRFGDALGSSE